MKDEIKGNINISFNEIFDYIKDKDFEISYLNNKINLKDKEIETYKLKIDKAIEYCRLNKEFTPRLVDIENILNGGDE